jgi:hypothetical protein
VGRSSSHGWRCRVLRLSAQHTGFAHAAEEDVGTVHRHDAHSFLCVLEGSVVMQLADLTLAIALTGAYNRIARV